MSHKNKLMMNGVPIDISKSPRSSDGALILNAAPMRVGDYDYFAFELSDSDRRGYRWDDQLIGRIELSDCEACLDQFKALPVTDDHRFVDIGERKDKACGTILKEGVMDGDLVRTEAEIHEPKTILKMTSGDTELSIGFYSTIEWNENRQEGEPHFFIRDIDLNHVAIVKEGRAGPDARLSNHKTKLKEDSENMEKITINNVEYEVDKNVAQEFSRLAKAETDLTGTIGTVTSERDQSRGQLASAKTELANAKTSADDMAVKKANQHSKFMTDATKLGHDTKDLSLGNYDEIAMKRDILKNNGVELDKDASDDMVRGAWVFAVSSKAETDKTESALDDLNPAPTISEHSPADAALNATNQSYFGKAKPNKAKKEE